MDCQLSSYYHVVVYYEVFNIVFIINKPGTRLESIKKVHVYENNFSHDCFCRKSCSKLESLYLADSNDLLYINVRCVVVK